MGGGGAARAQAPLLCWLCCWPQADRSDTSHSGRHRKSSSSGWGSRRRSGDFFSRRLASSAASLHVPSTSGHTKQPLSAHRSHEEIRSRLKSLLDDGSETRYHSAPSVIDEVLHRRDWERSSKELYIPLHPPVACNESVNSGLSSSPEIHTRAPLACLDSSAECLNPEPAKKCKKHYTNIKSSKGKCKESNRDDVKDVDATEVTPNFYIGDNNENNRVADGEVNSSKVKEAKQSFNESVRMKEQVVDGDRSGAVHHSIESRISLSRPYPLPSVDRVGYEEGACYLSEGGHPVLTVLGGGRGLGAGLGVGAGVVAGAGRARHASDGDILAPPLRPESGAFSESDLDVEIEASDERPPAYHDVCPAKETAI